MYWVGMYAFHTLSFNSIIPILEALLKYSAFNHRFLCQFTRRHHGIHALTIPNSIKAGADNSNGNATGNGSVTPAGHLVLDVSLTVFPAQHMPMARREKEESA